MIGDHLFCIGSIVGDSDSEWYKRSRNMENFEYDVAISFAGEQRPEAQAIAKELQKAGVKVFYDEYELATLWGKDLFEHLADVYQRKARYCLTLVSEAYAAKVWTTHERRNAQARALVQKTEYILPVRFDDTDIPGLPATVGYLRFQDHGVNGICDLLLQKLGKQGDVPHLTKRKVTTSPRACIVDPNQNLQAYIPVAECTWGNTEATLVFQPDDPTDGPFLESLRGSRHALHIAFKTNIGLCRVEEVQHALKAGQDQWTLHLRIEQSDFTPNMEMGFQGMSADDIAEKRARRILLNENLFIEEKGAMADVANNALREVLIRGMQTPLQPTASPFPALYELYGREPTKFLEICWIVGVLLLKTSGAVAEVSTLEIGTDGKDLQVDFTGKRRKQYSNRPAAIINIKGTCDLAKRTMK